MRTPSPPALKPGMELTAAWLNWVLKTCKENRIELGEGSGLTMSQNENGTILRTAGSSSGQLQRAITNGAISARVGTSPGGGNVFLVSYNGTVYVTGVDSIPVLNYSSTTGGIATGVYCWIAEDPTSSELEIISVDCGN